LWILVGLLAAIGLVFLAADPARVAGFFTWTNLWDHVGRPLTRTLIFISVGLLIGQLIESMGWTGRLGRLARPLIGWARLPDTAGAAFASAFVSGVLANTMLLTGYREGRLNHQSLILANLINASVPAWVLHMPTTTFIIIGLTGRAGVIYMVLTFLAAVIRLVGAAAFARLTLPPTPYEPGAPEERRKRPWPEVWKETWPKFKTRLTRIVMVVVPVYLVVALVAEVGFFEWLKASLAGWAVLAAAPVEAMSVVIFSVAAEFTSGFAAAGALMRAGDLSVRGVVAALLIGNVVATPVRALRHQLAHYMGIYSPGLGLKLLAIGQSVRIASVLLVLAAFLLLW
jgi:hypothetical protein